MNSPLFTNTVLHWGAVFLYVLGTIATAWGIIFQRPGVEKAGFRLMVPGLLMHGLALGLRWLDSGHGPYMVKCEVLSSDAWLALGLFLLLARFVPALRPASLIVFPAVFLLVAISLFLNPAIQELPPTLRSIWLVFHVAFYKIALATLLIALACSIFFIVKSRWLQVNWLGRLPELPALDLLAYRFTSFGFVFWGIAMLSGSVWAYQSWGRFWGWDPVETWSLLTWVGFGLYLHLRRFFQWAGEKAAYLSILCFLLSIASLFFTALIESSAHSSYFS